MPGLDQRITLSTEQRSDDGGGGYDLVWRDVATVWAGIKPISGREQVQADQQSGTVRYRVIIRARAVPGGVSSDMRLIWRTNGDKILNVREVMDAGPRAAYLEFFAESGVGV